jgi:hypothetical protein
LGALGCERRAADGQSVSRPLPRKALGRLRTFTLAAVAAALIVPAVPAAAVATPSTADSAAIVCNEAENSWRGGYTVTGRHGRPDGPDGSVDPTNPGDGDGPIVAF